jgi:hypothetical protein
MTNIDENRNTATVTMSDKLKGIFLSQSRCFLKCTAVSNIMYGDCFCVITAKKDIEPFLQQHPEITVSNWSDIRVKVMNRQQAVTNRVKKHMAMVAESDDSS